MTSKDQNQNPWLVNGWIAMTVAVVLSIPVSRELVGNFDEGNAVQIREWMRVVNLSILGLHAALIIPIGVGCWRLIRRKPGAVTGAALVAVGATLLSVLGAMALDPWLGQGPFAVDDSALQTLRAGVFLPVVIRTSAWLTVALAAIESGFSKAIVCALIGADLGVCVWLWAVTPYALTAHLHPAAQYAPAYGAVFLVASVAFIAIVQRERGRN